LPIEDIQGAIGSATSQLQGADFGKLVTDATGKITNITGALDAQLPGLAQEFGPALGKVVPQLNDSLPALLDSPVLKQFPVTDIVQQLDTGFSIGVLDSLDMQGLNAAVVQQVGSLNNNAFVDAATKSVGKYGFNVDQLKSQGLVRPEAIFNDQLADPSVWTGKGGANSLGKFLGNGGLQEQVMQQVVASDYQKMLNDGAIQVTDGPKEVMGMLTAANISSTEVASAVRQGRQDFQGVIRNTTNIPNGIDVSSKVKDAISTGAAAAERVTKIKEPAKTTTTTSTTVIGDTTINEQSIVSTTGGGSTTTTTPVTGGETTTAKPYDPYSGKNGGKIKQIDDQIAQIDAQKFDLDFEGKLSPQQRKQFNDQLIRLYALRDQLQKGG
jgi:hypothetical protein